tara:strand:- start:18 stop:326 length:309 start_codon:yes stop_codon:yes gene_type:complete
MKKKDVIELANTTIDDFKEDYIKKQSDFSVEEILCIDWKEQKDILGIGLWNEIREHGNVRKEFLQQYVHYLARHLWLGAGRKLPKEIEEMEKLVVPPREELH